MSVVNTEYFKRYFPLTPIVTKTLSELSDIPQLNREYFQKVPAR